MGCTKALRITKKAVGRDTATRNVMDDCDCEPIPIGEVLAPISVLETESTVSVSVPLNGVDARHIYVLASPHAITIEILIRHAVSHSTIVYAELQHQCVQRELHFYTRIKEASTGARLAGNKIEITFNKEPLSDEKTWSEMIPINTRASLGCVSLS